jgi:hypothetical protein
LQTIKPRVAASAHDFKNVDPHSNPRCICDEISGEVRDIAISLYIGRLSAQTFENAVIALESAKLKRFGFHLAAERLPRGGSRFTLTDLLSGRQCATLDFDGATEKLAVHHICG